jgi:manganese/iron transport system permease protein
LLRLVVLVVVSVFYRQLLFLAFDPTVAEASSVPARILEYLLLGETIVTAIQAVGIVMVVALLVTPSATTYLSPSGSIT